MNSRFPISFVFLILGAVCSHHYYSSVEAKKIQRLRKRKAFIANGRSAGIDNQGGGLGDGDNLLTSNLGGRPIGSSLNMRKKAKRVSSLSTGKRRVSNFLVVMSRSV